MANTSMIPGSAKPTVTKDTPPAESTVTKGAQTTPGTPDPDAAADNVAKPSAAGAVIVGSVQDAKAESASPLLGNGTEKTQPTSATEPPATTPTQKDIDTAKLKAAELTVQVLEAEAVADNLENHGQQVDVDNDEFDSVIDDDLPADDNDDEQIAYVKKEPVAAFRHKQVQRFQVGKFEFTNHILQIFSDEDYNEFIALWKGLAPPDKINIVNYDWKAAASVESNVTGQSRAIRGATSTNKLKDPKSIR